ncbi:alkaline phosphatase D family protein [Hamadaea sp. NPDC051192]|uniref:alkaline phosphatase D family protein n=1 Tax=Hamadaea sp. NPDC051192 TaxID=3154940 RepID=UPI0034373B28
MTSRLSRRRFLGYSGAGTTAVLLGTGLWDTASASAKGIKDYPFTLGVASGDPTSDSVVLWTRLAVDALAPDGKSGMPDQTVPVQYQVATDENFTEVVRAGVAFATPQLGHSVHPEIYGLEPGRHYWYRFRVGSNVSPVGRTRTAPAPDSMPAQLQFAVASCQSYEGGHYTAYQHMAEEDLDLVLHLGDYIYETSYVADPRLHNGDPLPDHLHTECFDLNQYRMQYALYKSDVHLQAAHALCPWITTFDDHEVVDDWRSDTHAGEDPATFRQRKADAYQAMYENLPLRHTQMPSGPDIRIHRRLSYGSLADFTMLDTRQWRSAHVGRFDPNATMLGGTQRDWLLDGFSSSTGRWQIIGNQQPMGQVDRDPDPDVIRVFEAWDAYAVERELVLTEAHNRGVDNLVVVTGDRHSNYFLDLKADYDDPESPVVGVEIVGTSISSAKDGADMLPVGEVYLQANPHMHFCNFQRGYNRVTVTPQELRSDFRVVPYISTPDAPITTRATFVVENGHPGGVRA